MTTEIWAAMVEFDANGEFGGLTDSSYDVLDQALSTAAALLADAPPAAIKMFVAPEYTFSGHGKTESGGTQISSLSRSDKHGLYRKIKASSARHTEILIVPGSIAYSKARMFSARKYYNVCPIAAGGQIVHKYYKQSNDTYQSNEDFKSKDYGGTFTHMGKTFGIEICLDHGKKVLKGSGAAVDVQILISDGFAPSTMGIVAPMGSGAMVFCDMAGKGNGVKSIVANKYGNPNTGTSNERSRSQSLTGGVQIALYTGSVG